jgi:hypothetical protein
VKLNIRTSILLLLLDLSKGWNLIDVTLASLHLDQLLTHTTMKLMKHIEAIEIATLLSHYLIWGQCHPPHCSHVCSEHIAHFLLVHVPNRPGAVFTGGQQMAII